MRRSGIPGGFQWIDGSFLEDAETVRGRPPADIDLVTFASMPPGITARDFHNRHADLFDPRLTRPRFGCDAYFVDLGLGARRPDLLVMQSRYWYGLFSHQRASGLWKGMLQIDLYSDDEAVLNHQPGQGGTTNAAQA